MLYFLAALALAAAFIIAWYNYRFAQNQRLHITNERFLIHGLISAFLVIVGIVSASALVSMAIDEANNSEITTKEFNQRQQKIK